MLAGDQADTIYAYLHAFLYQPLNSIRVLGGRDGEMDIKVWNWNLICLGDGKLALSK